jgi:hypothetical protein
MYECLACGRQTSITAGTVMHRSKMPLTVWFSAAYLIATSPDGAPARQLEALLAIGHKNAWLLKQKLRQCMESEALEGLVGGRAHGDPIPRRR